MHGVSLKGTLTLTVLVLQSHRFTRLKNYFAVPVLIIEYQYVISSDKCVVF